MMTDTVDTAVQSIRHRANYNKHANQQLVEYLHALSEDELNRDRGSYYRSIQGILNHLLICDINLMRRFRIFDPQNSILKHTQLDPEGSDWFIHTIDSRAEWQSQRQVVDQLIIDWIITLPPETLAGEASYKNSKGKAFQHPLWILIDHMFNHQTHHRGQISQILDGMSIEHDFSGLLY